MKYIFLGYKWFLETHSVLAKVLERTSKTQRTNRWLLENSIFSFDFSLVFLNIFFIIF